MKKRTLIFIIFICILVSNAFGQEGNTQSRQLHRISINMEIVNMLYETENKLSELHYFLSSPLTIIVSDENIYPNFDVNKGNLLFSDQYVDLMRVELSANSIGKLHLYNNTSSGNEILEIIFTVQNRFVTLKFKRNIRENRFDLFSAIINGRPYTLNSQTALPQLMINSNFDLR